MQIQLNFKRSLTDDQKIACQCPNSGSVPYLRTPIVTEPTTAREEEIMSHILRDQDRKLFTCALCPFVAPGRHRVFCHLEAKHFNDCPVTYTCPYCGKTAASKNGMCLHISRNHKQEHEQSKSVFRNGKSVFPA